MSITTLINPSGEISIQDDLWHIASSDNSGQTDFKFVFDVFVNGVQLVRTKVFPDPTNGKGYFNASNVVRNEITFDWFTPVSTTQPEYLLSRPSTSGQIAQTYNLRVGEDYSGITTLNMASGNVKAYNYAPPAFKRRQQTISTFDGKYLTNRPKSAKIKLGDKLLVPFKGVLSETYVLKIRTYNAANALIATTSTTTGIVISEDDKFLQLDIGSTALNASAGATPITDAVAYYDVTLEIGTTIQDTFRVYLTCDNRYTPISLHFINAYGMYETATFAKSSRLTMDVERKSYQQRDFSFGASSVNYYDALNVYRETKINYGSKSNLSYKLTMDFPTDAEYQWLSELITSPQIFMELDGSYYPVSIKESNYEFSTNQNNQLRAFEINVDVNQTRYGYRR